MNTAPTLQSGQVRLHPIQPFNFEYTLTYFTRRAGELVDRAEDGVYRRLFVLGCGPVLAEVRPDADGSLSLNLRPPDGVALSTLDAGAAAAAVASTVTRTLGLADDLAPFQSTTIADRALAGVVSRYSGLRLVSTPSAFEAFVWAVIGQQISLHVAFRLKAALVQRFGETADIHSVRYWAFPTPESLAMTDPAELASLGLGRRKAETIVTTAIAVANGNLDLPALALLPLQEAEASLVRMHGVGPWTADYTLLRGLRVADACPVSDMGLRQACGRLYGLGRNATVQEVGTYAEQWRPFRGYAAFFLWFTLSHARNENDG